ncbi:uncharacterized protein LOC105279023 isoform X2 [Ooceraea biroi]|uniref:uncharacterized protein LOC105279023 isoform X2 n=1 Tax=Ooceraea biroi TaxID=2015173 RepID=UPI0005BC6F0C|nr:uncharacterized protein LOC105279023 isoform X2 [Ooceraea biroi]
MARWWPYNTIIVSSIFVISWYWTVFHGKKSRTDGPGTAEQISNESTLEETNVTRCTCAACSNSDVNDRNASDGTGNIHNSIPSAIVHVANSTDLTNRTVKINLREFTNVRVLREANTFQVSASNIHPSADNRSANLVISGGIDEINITVPTIVSTTVDTSSPPVVQTQAQTRIFRNRTRNTRSKNKEENAKS